MSERRRAEKWKVRGVATLYAMVAAFMAVAAFVVPDAMFALMVGLVAAINAGVAFYLLKRPHILS